MAENEQAARALVAQLVEAGIEARLDGAGVRWDIHVGPVGSRAMRVHCFWYEKTISALMLGVNPSNARSQLGRARPPYEGPEFKVVLRDGEARVADGRTREAADVVACARAWLAQQGVDELVGVVPFIDERARSMRALAARLDPRLRWEIGTDPSYELWVYGDGRSCKVVADDACGFLLGQVQVAFAADAADVPALVETWLVARSSLRALEARGAALERHAEVLETDPAGWHWRHVLDRIADPGDALAELRELIAALAASPIASAFYSFSSLNRLCFSASSHYLWVDDGLPVVAPASGGRYLVDGVSCDLARAVERIEATLAASPLRPLFGSAPHHELPRLADALARQGSALRPELVQRDQWYDLVVGSGARRCKVSGLHVAFHDETDRLDVRWPNLDDLADAIRRFCEGGATLDQVRGDRTIAPR